MLDNALIALVRTLLIAGEAAASIPDTPIKQAFQPTDQGVNEVPTVYLFKIGDEDVGSPMQSDVWDVDAMKMVHTQLQQVATTFQIEVLAAQSPSTPQAYTASDILNQIRAIMISQPFIEGLEAVQPYGVGIQKPGNPRNPYFQDDRGQNEASPSFDFTLTHKQVIITESPTIETTEFQILRV